MSTRGWVRRMAVAIALMVSLMPVAGVAHADPTEVTETFVATGQWAITGCTQVSCTFAGASTACVELEAVGSVANTNCHVVLNGLLGELVPTANTCQLALGAEAGNVIATFYDGSDPGAAYGRVGAVAGGAAVAEGLVITSGSPNAFAGVMATGAYVPTCPVTPVAQTFTVTTSETILAP